MEMEKQAAEKLLAGYAAALNAADTVSLSSFYTPDGLFMPDGFKNLTASELEKASGNYLKKSNFHIDYNINNVVIKNDYAFVTATALTRTASLEKLGSEHSSRDFFVLRKDGENWKIYRYIFNKTL